MAKKARRKGNPRKAVAYLRISTDEQHLGPEAQRAAIQEWADENGVQVVTWREDLGVSGAKDPDEREGLCAALSDLREHRAGHLVVAVRDRLARDVYGAAAIEAAAKDAGAVVTSAGGRNGDTPEDFLFRALEDYMAMVERLKIAQRTKAALQVKKARGERVGQVPYGWKVGADGVRLVKVPAEQAVIRRVKDLRAKGAPYRGICETLTREGKKPRNGGEWWITQIVRILAA